MDSVHAEIPSCQAWHTATVPDATSWETNTLWRTLYKSSTVGVISIIPLLSPATQYNALRNHFTGILRPLHHRLYGTNRERLWFFVKTLVNPTTQLDGAAMEVVRLVL